MTISNITYRNVKDSALTYGEMDDNFGRLANTSLQDVTENGNTTNLVIQVEGVVANTMTVNTIVITSDTGDLDANNITANSLTVNTGTDATGDLYYRDSTGKFSPLAIGSNTEVLTVVNDLPSWQPSTHGYTWSSNTVSSSQTVTLSVPSDSQDIIITWYYVTASSGADMQIKLANSTGDIITSGYWYSRWGVTSTVLSSPSSSWIASTDISDETYGVLRLVHMGSNQWHIDGKIIGDDGGVIEQQFIMGNVTIDSAITAVYLDAGAAETLTGTFNIGYRT